MSEELLSASKARIEDLLEPINGGVGEDISYDESFESIKAETDKLSALDGDSCNWSSIAVTSEEILQEKSKDFRVACYLATTKFRGGTLEGVLDGFVMLKEFTAKFWEDMYPPLRRIRARAGMVGWMSDQAGPVAIDIPLKAADQLMVKLLDDLSKEIDADFRERFGDHYPGMGKMRDAIRHYIRSCPKEAKKEPPKPAPVKAGAAPTAAAAPAAAAAGVDEITTPDEAKKALKPLGRHLLKISLALRGGKPEDPAIYKLSRIGMWIEITGVPPATDGKTLVPPPPPHVRSSLDQAATSQDWLNLLNLAETHASNFILWLDPHRFAATAMSALGAMFLKAKEELLIQVALHLKKFRGMDRGAFNDGTPFADAQTQAWIEAEVTPILASGEGGGGGGAAASLLDEPIKEARGLALKGELPKAIRLVTVAAGQAVSPVDRFKGKLAVAELCLRAGEFSIARGQFEGLSMLVHEHNLTTWDPCLCADVFAGLYAAHKGANVAATKTSKIPGAKPPPPLSPEAVQAERAAFEALCQLDPATALKLGGRKK